MNEELIKCPCCGKLVPGNDIELSYIRPDDLARLDQCEIDEHCQFSEDYYIYTNQYFFLRCVLPLPVNGRDREYCIGVWVQLSEDNFSTVWELWDDVNQQNNPPLKGLLANNVHLNSGCIGSDVLIRLVSPDERPRIEVLNEKCSLFLEQHSGISIHRVSEYSDLCR